MKTPEQLKGKIRNGGLLISSMLGISERKGWNVRGMFQHLSQNRH